MIIGVRQCEPPARARRGGRAVVAHPQSPGTTGGCCMRRGTGAAARRLRHPAPRQQQQRRALSSFRTGAERTAWLRARLEQPELLVMPCAYDGLTAGLVEKADFEVTFMSGFSVSASRGFPDCQLVSYAESEFASTLLRCLWCLDIF